MNQNDMDRYYWRTGHRWSGDFRPNMPRLRLAPRTITFLVAAFAVTQVLLFLLR